MTSEKQLKSNLHKRNLHNQGYDFELLSISLPELKSFLITNPHGQTTIDFSNNLAVKNLNKALLKAHYQIDFWDIPETYLCPPIPGRVDYIHYLADLLAEDNQLKIPTGKKISMLDIGTGANLVYPITANKIYGWQATASDIDPISIKVAKHIAQFNKLNVTIKQQKHPQNTFIGLIKAKQFFDITLCNPPFHASITDAEKGTQRKWKNLGKATLTAKNKNLNFGGQNAELWCPGGELTFIKNMIEESTQFKQQCLWFTSLVSKKDNLSALYKYLKQAKVTEFKTVNMAQGQKNSRFIAWTYFNKQQRREWAEQHWC